MGQDASKSKMTDQDKMFFRDKLCIRIGRLIGSGKHGTVYEGMFTEDAKEMVKRAEKESRKIELIRSPEEPGSEAKDNPKKGTKVAIKWLKIDEVNQNQVKEETKSLIRHPNVMDIRYSLMFKETQNLAIIMDLSPIGSLLQWCGGIKEQKPGLLYMRKVKLTPEQYHKLGKGFVSGLNALHGNGILHRDLQDGNILMFPDPVNKNEVIGKLADFGMSEGLRLKDRQGKWLVGQKREIEINGFKQWVEIDRERMKRILRGLVYATVEKSKVQEAFKRCEELCKELDSYSVEHLFKRKND